MYRLQTAPPGTYNLEGLALDARVLWGSLVHGDPNEHEDGQLLNFYFVDDAGIVLSDVVALLAAHDPDQKTSGQLSDTKALEAGDVLAGIDLAALSAKNTTEADAIVALVEFLRIQ